MKTQYVVDLISDVVDEVADVLNIDINYMYGHPFEIIDNLQKMTRAASVAAEKFPLIALFTDFRERRGLDGNIYSEVDLNLIIAVLTDPKYLAPERYTLNFKPTLYPIYFELLNQLHASHMFDLVSPDGVPHDKYDRLYWGRTGLYEQNGNLFQDYIDAIEIQNLNLKIKQIIC